MEAVVFCKHCRLVIRGNECSCKGTGTAYKQGQPKKHPSNTRKFQKLRKQILKRDGAHCVRCRIKYDWMVFDNLQAHHIKSWRDYPELAYDELNLITVCRNCNLELGTSNKLDFKWKAPELEIPTL
ncbi:HNH endonuclease [Priestia megaterium]|uniref:HNH endonuclease n=1 Tax=Priestia megaterium TaxID=1404 RepID=A0A3D8WY64_PRIMG|nr:HNH endonuclease signature motif containing protein [Priestia megaterium]MDH3173651.1 HNH endonuclease signature motif containing protein [Priestia megaterium]RDZ11504.1 HNH endonuclease [Priestia megaterium]